MLRFFILIVFTLSSLSSYAIDSLKSVDASYIFYYKNMAAGTMDLKINNEENKIIASTTYKGNFIASMLHITICISQLRPGKPWQRNAE